MDGMTLLRVIGTLSAFTAFVGICWWAYTPANKKRFEQDGRLVLDTDPVYQNKHHDSGDKSE